MQELNAADAAILETFVVPRYLRLFGELALEMLLLGESSRIAHLGCRTGYPDRILVERAERVVVVGLDPSAPAIDLARSKVLGLSSTVAVYESLQGFPSQLDPGYYSHALALHPIVSAEERRALFREMARLVYQEGQAVIALPIRGSFQELVDLFKEYALRGDHADFAKAIDEAQAARPTIESLSDELENVGFEDVDVEIRQTEIPFDDGRAFLEDPITRLLVLPEVGTWLKAPELGEALDYARDAIGKYWAESPMQLTLNIGCASARKS